MRSVVFAGALLVVPLAAAALDAKLPQGWQEATRNSEVIVFFKENEQAQARDILAYAEFDAPPEISFAVVTDFEHYPRFMPYVKDSKIVRKNAPGDLITYGVTAAPLIPDRDYFMHILLTRGSVANGGVFKSTWTSTPDLEPEKPGIVRMRLNEGYWTFEPIDGGKRTRATYSLLSSPGGWLPKWIVDQASVATVPDIMKAIRQRVMEQVKSVR